MFEFDRRKNIFVTYLSISMNVCVSPTPFYPGVFMHLSRQQQQQEEEEEEQEEEQEEEASAVHTCG